VAGPVESSLAFHLMKMESRDPEEVTPLDKASDGISEQLREARFKEKIDAYLKKLWSDNFIYVYPKFGTSDWLPAGASEEVLGG
jgi:parvulin-like peptidyl-prolyl isomerase